MRRILSIGLCVLLWAIGTIDVLPVTASAAVDTPNPPPLSPTFHPPLSRTPGSLWLVPSADLRQRASDTTTPALKNGIEAHKEGRHAEAVKQLAAVASSAHVLAGYAAYYAAVSHFELGNLSEAERLLKDLRSTVVQGYLIEAAAIAEATVAEEQQRYSDAVDIYRKLTSQRIAAPAENWMRLARASIRSSVAQDRERAAEILARVYYEFPFSEVALDARAELDRLGALEPLGPQTARYKLDLGRAERFFASRRCADAQLAFKALQRYAVGGDRDLIALRMAECDYFRKRYRFAREALKGLLDRPPRQAEARYFYTSTLRGLGLRGEYLRSARDLIERYPDSTWSEDMLNDLATFYIRDDDDATADGILRELYAGFPGGRYAERAGWKIGWRAYRGGQYAEAINYFELTARQFPRSDYRPSFLYWSGRAHEALGALDTANARYALTTTDYLNTYYGRLAAERLARSGRSVAPTSLQFTTDSESEGGSGSRKRPTDDLIRWLLALEFYDEALNELRYAERTWGEDPILLATVAWIYSQQGDQIRAIATLKRAYPQYMASGGEQLPPDLLRVVFPISYWEEIRGHAERHNLSPYLLAALVAQESGFDPKIRSSKKAVGLMQVMPATGRRYARRLRIPGYRVSMLTSPKTNLTIGSALFADLVEKFGHPYLALAAYNAGDSRVARWVAERSGETLEREVFIDDIPFPETQGYVRKILSTSEDYRRLYGETSGATR
ncbi:MAG TPA: transglycosylase SLT domain-containing protein [Vicinamibacterales bacterium]